MPLRRAINAANRPSEKPVRPGFFIGLKSWGVPTFHPGFRAVSDPVSTSTRAPILRTLIRPLAIRFLTVVSLRSMMCAAPLIVVTGSSIRSDEPSSVRTRSARSGSSVRAAVAVMASKIGTEGERRNHLLPAPVKGSGLQPASITPRTASRR